MDQCHAALLPWAKGLTERMHLEEEFEGERRGLEYRFGEAVPGIRDYIMIQPIQTPNLFHDNIRLKPWAWKWLIHYSHGSCVCEFLLLQYALTDWGKFTSYEAFKQLCQNICKTCLCLVLLLPRFPNRNTGWWHYDSCIHSHSQSLKRMNEWLIVFLRGCILIVNWQGE